MFFLGNFLKFSFLVFLRYSHKNREKFFVSILHGWKDPDIKENLIN